MIRIDRDGTNLRVTLTSDSHLMTEVGAFTLTWNTGSVWAASLLVDHFQRQVQSHLHRIREEEYASGWKDAKAKKSPKRTWFMSGWK